MQSSASKNAWLINALPIFTPKQYLLVNTSTTEHLKTATHVSVGVSARGIEQAQDLCMGNTTIEKYRGELIGCKHYSS